MAYMSLEWAVPCSNIHGSHQSRMFCSVTAQINFCQHSDFQNCSHHSKLNTVFSCDKNKRKIKTGKAMYSTESGSATSATYFVCAMQSSTENIYILWIIIKHYPDWCISIVTAENTFVMNSVYLHCQVSVSVVYFTWHTSASWDWNIDRHTHCALYSETKCSETINLGAILVIQNDKPMLSKVFFSNSWSF